MTVTRRPFEEGARMPPVLLLAGGLGTRLRPLTNRLPKCLVPVAGRPVLDYWQANFVRHGFHEIVINVHAHADQVVEWISERNARGPVKWEAFEEPALLGSAGTLRANLKRLETGPDFVVLYADNLSEVDLAGLVRRHRARAANFTMGLFDAPNPSECGIATLGPDGMISAFVEKPSQPRSNLANAGVYVVRSGFLEAILRPDDFDIGHDLLPRLGARMHGDPFGGYHRDVGSPEALASIESDLAAGRAPELLEETP